MGAADIFTRLKAGGFRLRLSGETLMISPAVLAVIVAAGRGG